MPLKILCIAGTRPEYIKVFPVYRALLQKSKTSSLEIKWLRTSQHFEMIKDLEIFFEIKADFILDLNPEQNQKLRLAALSKEILWQLSQILLDYKPDLVLVQGDTLSAQQAALAAFYLGIKIGHIEAGIRTNDIYSPFPEELARRIISQISDLNFAPTELAYNTLEAEKIMFKAKSYNFLTGNTVIDTLDYSIKKIDTQDFDWKYFGQVKQSFDNQEYDLLSYIKEKPNYILVTSHRRENKSTSKNLARALYRIAIRFQNNLDIIISVHKNPELREAFEELYGQCIQEKISNIKFFDAINYPLFLKLLANSLLVITDSGGIQEEAPYLSKPVLVVRNETERTEGIKLGLSKLIGTEEHLIHGYILEILLNENLYQSMIKNDLQPYGDGLASQRIADVIALYLLN